MQGPGELPGPCCFLNPEVRRGSSGESARPPRGPLTLAGAIQIFINPITISAAMRMMMVQVSRSARRPASWSFILP
jgi:hypothetical protein